VPRLYLAISVIDDAGGAGNAAACASFAAAEQEVSTMRFLSTALIVGCLVLLMPHRAGAADDAASGLVRTLGQKTLTLLNAKLPAEQLEPKFRELLHEGFDIEKMSRFVLASYWRSASDAERQEFTRLFETYIVQAYSRRFSSYSGEQLKITGSREEGESTTLVSSEIVRPTGGPPVRVEWRVIRTAQGGKIVDVIVENISMVLTQKQEFASILQRSGGQLASLLTTLREKTAMP
jgi:phospholipid transport system substrate-binding protein